jgi:hypothetical protein
VVDLATTVDAIAIDDETTVVAPFDANISNIDVEASSILEASFNVDASNVDAFNVDASNVDASNVDVTAIPSMGSSRITGGFIRGHAYGNVLNHADFNATAFETPIMGEVYLYVTDEYPRHVSFELLQGESELVVMVKVAKSMAPILKMVARKFSVIQSECISTLNHNLDLKFYLDQDYHLYYRKSMKWIVLGTYDQAIEDDDEIRWEMSDGGDTHELHLLIVSL